MRPSLLHAVRDPPRHGGRVRGVQGAGVLLTDVGPGRYRAVLFDAGNTLVHIDPHRLRDVFAEGGCAATVEEIARAELAARRVLHEALAEGHVGTEPEVWQGYFATLFRLVGVTEGAVTVVGEALRVSHEEAHMWTGVPEGTAEALDRLRAAGYRLAVISNADGRVAGVLHETGLADRFEFVIDSEVVGVEKPDRRIFDEAVARLGIPAAACLYVGDLYRVDYLGATGAGLGCVLVDPLGLHDGRAPTVTSLVELPDLLGEPADG